MSTPSPPGAPKPSPPAMMPVTPLPDTLCVPPPPPKTAQSAKRARTADEEVRHAHASTASPAASGPLTSLAGTLISEALAKAEVYRSFAAFLDTELARLSVVSPAHAREADHLARTITTALQKSSASSLLSLTPDSTAPAGKKVSTSSAPTSKGKGPISFAEAAARGADSTPASRSTSRSHSSPTRKATLPQSDGRVFLRLDRDSPFANNDAFAIRKEVQSLLRLAPTDIPGCHKVPSGFALVPKDDAVRQTLLAHKDEIGARFGCVQVEVPKKW
ncbi:hypothetical protein B0H65DRAFT_411503, partial [Neurospora tetraspora]